MSLIRKVPTILLYFITIVPTLPVVVYDWGRYFVESIDPTGAFEFEVPPITEAFYCHRDYSKCPDPKGSGLLDKPISDLFVMCFLIGVGWLLMPLLSTCKCALKLNKCTQAVCIFFVSVFTSSASLLWHIEATTSWDGIGGMTLEAMNGHGVKLQFLTSVKSCQIMLPWIPVTLWRV